MTRDDLKEGMFIEERDGVKYLISSNKKVVYVDNPNSVYTFVQYYNHDLTYANTNSTYTGWGDIVRVYDENMNLLWDRERDNIDIDTKELEKIIKKYRDNPIEYMKDYLGIKLTWYQEMMLKKILNESEE